MNGMSVAPEKQSMRRTRLRTALDVTSTLASLVVAITLVWMVFLRPAPQAPNGRSTPPVPTEPVSLEGAPLLGAATAPVVMLQFSDFECSFCAKFVIDVWPQIKAAYVDTGEVQVAFRHLPLSIHDRAQRAAESAVCAAAQQKFWPMHDELFAGAGKLRESDLVVYSRNAGVDAANFASCMQGDARKRVQEDAELARSLRLSGTPAFLIGVRQGNGYLKVSRVVVGARPFADFKEALGAARIGAGIVASVLIRESR